MIRNARSIWSWAVVRHISVPTISISSMFICLNMFYVYLFEICLSCQIIEEDKKSFIFHTFFYDYVYIYGPVDA